jgi:uncharacterized coiled-coil DUF342 family protein
MSTKTSARIDEMRDRIDQLEARVQADGGRAGESMKGRLDALRRQEASARAAVRDHSPAAGLKVRLLEARLKVAEHGLAAELADNRKDFIEAMDAYVDDYFELNHALKETAASRLGEEREQDEENLRVLRHDRDKVAERLSETREQADDRWHESRRSVGAARGELDRKVDDTMEKLQ